MELGQNYLKTNNGFSLVELIVVVTIAAMIAVVAAPRFVNIKREATAKNLSNIRGNLDSLATLVFAKAKAQGVENGNIQFNGRNIRVIDGYPQPHWNNAFRYLLNITANNRFTPVNQRCSGFALCGVGNQRSLPGIGTVNSGRVVMIWPEGYWLADQCYVYYHHPENGGLPTTGEVLSGC